MELSSRQADLDALARQQIPGYSSLARLSVSLLAGYPSLQPSGSQVLVVGCGTGAELREAQGLRPDWALTGVDPAASLLDEAVAAWGLRLSRCAGWTVALKIFLVRPIMALLLLCWCCKSCPTMEPSWRF